MNNYNLVMNSKNLKLEMKVLNSEIDEPQINTSDLPPEKIRLKMY